jgi:hypothetical protein
VILKVFRLRGFGMLSIILSVDQMNRFLRSPVIVVYSELHEPRF